MQQTDTGKNTSGTMLIVEDKKANPDELYLICKDTTTDTIYFQVGTNGKYAGSATNETAKLSGKFVLHFSETEIFYNANNGLVDYTIEIPKTVEVAGNRETDKFQVKIDTTQKFMLEYGGKVNVKIKNTANAYKLVNNDDNLPYNLTATSSDTSDISNNPLVSFVNKTDNPKNVYINFTPANAKYAGKYSDLMTFDISYNKTV
jgi:hypothetical protein